MRVWILVLAVLLTPATASAQSVRSELAASNGVVVTVHADEFANRYEYSAPLIDLPNLGGFALVVVVKTADRIGPTRVQGSIMYQGDWRRYDSAVFRGGAAVNYTAGAREVVSCRGSRYSGCSLREGFSMSISPDEMRTHAEDGILRVQVRSSMAANPVMFEFPVGYFAAVEEVAARPASALVDGASAAK